MYEGGILTAAFNGSDAAAVHVIMSDRSVLTYSPDVRTEDERTAAARTAATTPMMRRRR